MGGLQRRALVVTLVVVLAACGGGDDDATDADDAGAAASATGADTDDGGAEDRSDEPEVDESPTANDPASTEPATTAPSGNGPPGTDPAPTDPPAPDLDPGELREVITIDGPTGEAPTSLYTHGRQSVIQYRIRGDAHLVEWPSAASGLRAGPEPTTTAIALPAPFDSCADPASTGCRPFVAGFDPSGCLLVHTADGVLHCFDITDPASPTDVWSFVLCPDGMAEMAEGIDHREQCEARPITTIGDYRVMTPWGGRLTVFDEAGMLLCDEPSTDFSITVSPVFGEDDAVWLTVRNIFSGDEWSGKYSLAQCRERSGEPDVPIPHGLSVVTDSGELWTLVRDDQGNRVVSSSGLVVELGALEGWDRPELITNGEIVLVRARPTGGPSELLRVDGGTADGLSSLPVNVERAAFDDAGDLVIVTGNGRLGLYDVG